MNIKPNGKILCRFSCGAASAVATKLAIKKYGKVEINYSDTGSEHPDNHRFIRDCENWFGQEITISKSEKFSDIWEVFLKRRYIVGISGAPCTSEMKRLPGDSVWSLGDVEIFGYTVEEKHRVERFESHNSERIIECPLIDRNLTKDDCLAMLDRAGIKIPEMYQLGFRNNNCIGCVKANSIDYWKRVRKYFPDVFQRMANIERELDTTINRVTKNGERIRVFLDEIEDGEPKSADPNIQCGLFCHVESENLK